MLQGVSFHHWLHGPAKDYLGSRADDHHLQSALKSCPTHFLYQCWSRLRLSYETDCHLQRESGISLATLEYVSPLQERSTFQHSSASAFSQSQFSPSLNTGLLGCYSESLLLLLLLLLSHFSRVRLFTTPWTAAYQAPPSMGFSRQEY